MMSADANIVNLLEDQAIPISVKDKRNNDEVLQVSGLSDEGL